MFSTLAMSKSLKPKTEPVASSCKANYLKTYCASRDSTDLQTPLNTALNVPATHHLPFQISTVAVLCHQGSSWLTETSFFQWLEPQLKKNLGETK